MLYQGAKHYKLITIFGTATIKTLFKEIIAPFEKWVKKEHSLFNITIFSDYSLKM